MIKKIGWTATIFFGLDAWVLINLVMLNMTGQWGDVLAIGLASDLLALALFTSIALVALAIHRSRLKKKAASK